MKQKLIKTAIVGLAMLALLLLGLTGYLIIYPEEMATPPAPTSTIAILKWEGESNKIVEFNVKGYNAVRFGSGYFGNSNFYVHVLDEHGNLAGLAANCLGACTDDKIVRIQGDGKYYLEITADAHWFIVAMPLK